jgi:hypothetical protein
MCIGHKRGSSTDDASGWDGHGTEGATCVAVGNRVQERAFRHLYIVVQLYSTIFKVLLLPSHLGHMDKIVFHTWQLHDSHDNFNVWSKGN